MTEENLPNPETTGETERSHRNRRRPRRTGGQGTVSTQADSTISNEKIDNLPAENAENEQADAAAMSEGGIKTIGNQRILGFMDIKKPMVIISSILMIVAVLALGFKQLNLGLDFTGGVSADVVYEKPVEQQQVVDSLVKNGFDKPVVQYLGTNQELLVRLPPQETSSEGLSEALKTALNIEGNIAEVNNVNIIGGQIGNEVYLNSLFAMALALLCMLGYVALRFQFKLSVGAVIALFHDAIVTLGVFALLGLPFDLSVLAAILALIGYSLNDTIVVYDRIRENFRRVRGLSPDKVVDLSLTETLRRTFMTSMTVILVVGAMIILGGDGLKWFSITLFIGLIVGTYSSVYIASAIPLMMGMSRDDFVVTVKPEFLEDEVQFEDNNAPNYEAFDEDYLEDELLEDVNKKK